MNILGLSAFFHESACCLLRDGGLVAAAEEERFSRVKHDPRLPVSAFRFCLREGGIGITEVDSVAYYESPVKKLSRQLWAGTPEGASPDLDWLDPGRAPERAIREGLGWDGPILTFDHHLSHAASAFFVLRVHGGRGAHRRRRRRVGDDDLWRGRGAAVELFEEVDFPHSLGLLYATITSYLGFEVNDGEYKVMGLAPYGEPRFLDAMRRLVSPGSGRAVPARPPVLRFRPRPADVLAAPCRASSASRRGSLSPRSPASIRTWRGASRRCSRRSCSTRRTGSTSGPVSPTSAWPAAWRSTWSPTAASCARAPSSACSSSPPPATRAAAWAPPPWPTSSSPADGREPLRHVYLGPRWSSGEIAGLLAATGIAAYDFRGREAELLEAVVDRLARRRGGRLVPRRHGAGPPRARRAEPARRSRATPECATA